MCCFYLGMKSVSPVSDDVFQKTLLIWPDLDRLPVYFLSSLPRSSGGGYHGYDESYGSPPYEGRRMGPPMRGRGGRSYGPGYGPPPPPPGEYGGHAESPVVMLYGLDPTKMNADRVFNIFCLYGNVERVSILSVSAVRGNISNCTASPSIT